MQKQWKEGQEVSWLLVKRKENEDNVYNLFAGDILCGEVFESRNLEKLE